ncbi:MAG: hypothetical protein ACLTRP_02285 [Clostridioides difficile]
MGIVLITALVLVMYGLSILSYISESNILEDTVNDNNNFELYK